MIRRDHTAPDKAPVERKYRAVVDDAAAAALEDMKVRAWRNQKRWEVAGFPEPVSRKGSRLRYWDLAQLQAFHAGETIPALPADHPDDLLDIEEARAILKNPIAKDTWRGYLHDGFAPPADEVKVGPIEMQFWCRRTITQWDESRPGRGRGVRGGRPKGVHTPLGFKASHPNHVRAKALREEAAQVVAEGTDITGAAFAQAHGIGARYGERLLAAAREAGREAN
jgi:hypothetical protein